MPRPLPGIPTPPDRRCAFERLLATHAADLEAIVRRYVDDPADRDDLRQEIAIALWRAMPRFRGAASERTYVARIARNRAVTFALRLARRRAVFEVLDDAAAAVRPDTGEHDLEALRARVGAALDDLPTGQREVLVLATAGCSPAQIAARTGRSPGAIRVTLHRARRAIRRWLDGDAAGGSR